MIKRDYYENLGISEKDLMGSLRKVFGESCEEVVEILTEAGIPNRLHGEPGLNDGYFRDSWISIPRGHTLAISDVLPIWNQWGYYDHFVRGLYDPSALTEDVLENMKNKNIKFTNEGDLIERTRIYAHHAFEGK